MTTTLTTTVTDEQIRALRTEAGEAGDGEQVVICERALATDAEWDTDEWTGGGERPEFYRRLATLSQADARLECARVIAEAGEQS